MKEILEALAAAQGWVFEYGRRDHLNLFNELEKKGISHLFLDPVKRQKVRNDSGEIESYTYSGGFMLLRSSDIDETTYDFRYLNYVKPILDGDIVIIEQDLICNHEATLTGWEELEIINVFSQNLDGVAVTYTISINA